MTAAGRYVLTGLIAMLGLRAVAGEFHQSSSQSERQDAEMRTASPGLIRFDMPRQPLQTALAQFHRLTGQSLLYDGAIADGKTAGEVQGEFTPEAALRRLLAGTDIVADYTSRAAFVLVPGSHRFDDSLASSALDAADAMPSLRHDFYGRLQARVAAALCGDPVTIPGSYRLAVNVWIGPDGAIERVVLHPTGDARRDARIHRVLTGLALQAAPPGSVQQPVSLLILPRQPSQTGDCGRGEAYTRGTGTASPLGGRGSGPRVASA